MRIVGTAHLIVSLRCELSRHLHRIVRAGIISA
jgi:hypothetical protein